MSSKKRKTPSSNGTTIPSTAHAPVSEGGGSSVDNNTEKWRCDICLVATFDTYNEALVHEQSCTHVHAGRGIVNYCDVGNNMAEGISGPPSGGTNSGSKSIAALAAVGPPSKSSTATTAPDPTITNTNSSNNSNKGNQYVGDNKKGVVVDKDGNMVHAYNSKGEDTASSAAVSAKKKLKPNDTNPMDDDNATLSKKVGSNTSSATITSFATSEVSSATETTSNKRKTNWRCDVCLEAVFEDYDEAVEHEKKCTGNSSGKGSNKKSKSKKKKAKKNEEAAQQPFEAEVVHTQPMQAQLLQALVQAQRSIQKGSFVIVYYRYLGKSVPRGMGQVINVHRVVCSDGSQKTTFDVDFILGGHEKNIDSGSIILSTATNWEDAKKEAERWDDMNKRYMAAMNTKKSPTKKKTPPKVIVKPMAARSPAPLLHSPIEKDKVEQDQSMTHNDSFEHSPNSAFTTLPRSTSSGTMQQQQGVDGDDRVDVLQCQGDTSYSVSKFKAVDEHSRQSVMKNPPKPLHVSMEKDVGDFSEMTVPQLKERLKDSNLPVSGRKQELIDRLNDHIGAKLVESVPTLNMDAQGEDETVSAKDEAAPAPATTDSGSPPKLTTHVVKARTGKAILLALPVALVALAPLHVPERLFAMLLLPTTVTFITLATILLITFAYSTFAFTMLITHEGPHHHQTQGLITDLYWAARDYNLWCRTAVAASTDKSDGEATSTPTLREFLEHPDGFHMSFAPAFFGFFAYFGCLAALEEETNRIVPTLPVELQQENGDDANSTSACGLRSVSGASAGAMSAVMLASGIQPRDAARFASKFSWGQIADPPGIGGYVRGNNFESAMRTFISDAAKIRRSEGDKEMADNDDTPFQLEEALVPVSVSGFDLLTMKGTDITTGCMAKAARASASFPLLFQPVSWRESNDDTNNIKKSKWLPDSLLIDGGITDGLGLNGLGAFSSDGEKKKRVINFAVGDFGYKGPSGIDSLPPGVNAKSLVSIAIVGTPMCGPWAMKNGPLAVESASKAMIAALDKPMGRGTSDNHYVLRVDASKFVP